MGRCEIKGEIEDLKYLGGENKKDFGDYIRKIDINNVKNRFLI